MQFNIYDLLSKVIPGGLAIVLLMMLFLPYCVNTDSFETYFNILKEFQALVTAGIVIIAYILGYVLDGIGSLFIEPLFWFIWSGCKSKWEGWPIVLLHKGKTTSRTTLPNHLNIYELIISTYFGNSKDELTKDKYDELYYFVQTKFRRECNEEEANRQESYVQSYLFSRNLFATTLLCFLVALILPLFSFKLIALVIMLTSFTLMVYTYYRSKDKALYQTRHLLKTTHMILNKK